MPKELRHTPGEIYYDILTVDAFQRGVSTHAQADSLLGAKLQEREPMIVQRNNYLAWKRGISPSQMWMEVLVGKAKPIDTEELSELLEKGLIDIGGNVPGLRS